MDSRGLGDLTALLAGDRLVILGWVIGQPVAAAYLEVLDGETVIARAPINQRREDVAEAHPGIPEAVGSGFRFDVQAEEGGVGLLDVKVVFDDDNEVSLGEIEVAVEESVRQKLRPARWRRRGRDARGSARARWTIQVRGEQYKVLAGREKWLFLQNDSNDVIGQHTGQVAFADDALRRWARLMGRRAATARTVGFVWLFVIVPDKEATYAEFLPPQVIPASQRPVHALLDIAGDAQVSSLYLLEAMKAAKDDGELFPKTDTHWNYRGAYVGYLAICDRLRQEGIELDVVADDALEWEKERFAGDLGSKLQPPVSSVRPLPRMSRVQASLIYDNEVSNHGRVKIFERPDSGAPTCVVFGESFAEALLLFLRESFSRLVFVHTSMFVDEILEQEQPDVVLSIPIERFLVRVPEDDDALMKLGATARAKHGELPWPIDRLNA